MKIDAISLIYLFGAIQALLLVIGINYKQPLATTSKVMTSLLLVVMLVLMSYYTILLNELPIFYPYIHSLGSAVWMGITPAYYLLLKSIRVPQWKPRPKHLLYFIFPLIFLVEFGLTLCGVPAWLFLLVDDNRLFLDIWMGMFFLSGFYFVGKAIRQQRQPPQLEKNNDLRWFSYILMLVLVVFAVLYFVGAQRLRGVV